MERFSLYAIVSVLSFNCVVWGDEGQGRDVSRDAHRSVASVDGILAELQVERHGDLLLIPLKLGEHRVQFALDTGAAISVIDRALLKQIEPLSPSSRAYPKDFPEVFQLPPTTIADADVPLTGDTICLDLEQLRIASGHDVRGILGMNVLKQFVIEIDFDRGLVRFRESPPPDVNNGLDLGWDRFRRPLLDIEFDDGRVVPFIIDTGMAVPGIGEVKREIFQELVETERVVVKGPPARAATVRSDVVGRRGRLDRLRVGEFEHSQMGIREGSLNALGLGYLSRYHVTLDLPKGVIYLTKSHRFDAPASFDMSGMVLVRRDGKTKVERVHPSGPAYALGIRSGDTLVDVNSQTASSYSLLQLRRMCSVPGQQLVLRVKSGETIHDYTLRLTDWQSVMRR